MTLPVSQTVLCGENASIVALDKQAGDLANFAGQRTSKNTVFTGFCILFSKALRNLEMVPGPRSAVIFDRYLIPRAVCVHTITFEKL